VLVNNLEREPQASYGIDEHERIVRDHLLIKSGGDPVPIDALSHIHRGHRADVRSDGSTEYASVLARPGEHTHDEALLATALAKHFGLVPRERGSSDVPAAAEVDPEAMALFDETLSHARKRLFGA
jgi:hypothetical protein